jgi:hypothetical protein
MERGGYLLATLWNLTTPSPGDNAYHLLKVMKKFEYVLHSRINWSWDSSVSIATRIPAGQPNIKGSVPCRGKRFFCPPHCPDWLWAPLRFL